ncbi:DnaB-like helicase C-terminal domain-containing protein [Desulforhopalus sp. IMCC35007]|uniref:DnaB-like helicase C-terminal domain-containing protein n=1 Tax=Desulforhopalus sp. IMCC35007 TaxID=2569543 RepID=UPI0010AE0D94|nr:DnaB-like helicase C-terminal domain-containing protein [Desulforhopalus sp. IMCC35007]TKB10662.1 DNA helicase [Desulforhopalus sp. IMCC35007]
MEQKDPIISFYARHLGDVGSQNPIACPFCEARGYQAGRIVIALNRDSFFHGYFRCTNSCVPGGFPLWFAKLSAIAPAEVPGYDPELEESHIFEDFPAENINEEVASYQQRLSEPIVEFFRKKNVSRTILSGLGIGFNGRYIVYPYVQADGNCYAARCVYPGKKEDYFWQGNERYTSPPYTVFNRAELNHCQQGALFLCEEENILLAIKQLGFPAVAVPHHSHFEQLPAEIFAGIKTVFMALNNSADSLGSGHAFASRLGYKVRILPWPETTPAKYGFWQLAQDSGKEFGQRVGGMIKKSRSFSPFTLPEIEYQRFLQGLKSQQGSEYRGVVSGFPLFDEALGGVHGINIIGGAPKVGKSTFTIQIAAQMARKGVPVLYYDFENGRQKIYQRTLSRLSRVATSALHGTGGMGVEEQGRLEEARVELERMLFYWRVVNDRKITPELMRKHIEFIRHETRSEYTVVIIDSLHKLPFHQFAEQRTGIDAWLRQMESIRDELKVSFLVISELSRGAGDSYEHVPHLGVFKGSGDIEYSADNAMVLFPGESSFGDEVAGRKNCLWLVASREHSPGRIAEYQLDYPFWGFVEHALTPGAV